MVKIKIEKIQLPDGKFSVHFFPEMGTNVATGNYKVDLSRENNGKSLYRVDQLNQHNNNASTNHTAETVDIYINRVMVDIAEALKQDGLAVESDVEKVKGIFIPIFAAPGSTIQEN